MGRFLGLIFDPGTIGGSSLWRSLGDYYHDKRMQKMFTLVEQPKNIEDIDISESFIKNLIIKDNIYIRKY